MRKPVAPRSSSERGSVIEVASRLLGRFAESFVSDGRVPSHLELGGGTRGDLAEASSYHHDRSVVSIYVPCQDEIDTATAWHRYWREHEYNTLDPELQGGQPAFPSRGGGVWVGLTWTRIRTALAAAETAAAEQLELFDVVAA